MKIQILFHTSSSPKEVEARAVYTKGALLCVELADGNMIVKYPLMNIFSVAHEHGDHWGTTREK